MSAELPDGWAWTTLKDIGLINAKPLGELPLDMEVSFIPMSSVQEETGKLIPSQTRLVNQVNKGYTYFEENDILFAKITPCMENGKIAIAKGLRNNIGFGSTEYHVVRAHKVEVKYLLHYLLQKEIRNQAKKNMTGSLGQKRVPTNYFSDIPLPLPPLNEQRRIVAKLEALFSEVDAAVAQLLAVRQQLTVYRQAVLQAAFAGKLTAAWRAQQPHMPTAAELLVDIHTERAAQAQATRKKLKPVAHLTPTELAELPDLPEGWVWVKLGDYTLDVTDGDHQPPPKSEQGVPFITISCIDDGKIDFSRAFSVPEDYYANLLPNRKPQKGDILYTVTGSYGVTVLVDFEDRFCFQRHIGLIRPAAQSSRHYLKYFLDSPFAKAQAESVATGTAQKTVSLKGLRNFAIPLADEIEQRQIVLEIEARLSVADKLAEAVETSLRQAEVLRQSLLHRAFQGQLVPQDPTDEPASALLARIRAAAPSPRSPRGRNPKPATT